MTRLSRLFLVLLLIGTASCSPASQSTSTDGKATEEIESVEETIAPPTVPATNSDENTASTTEESSATEESIAEPAPTNTPRPTSGGLQTIIYANARSCPWMSCPVLASFSKDQNIEGGQLVEGGRVEGSKNWWRINHEGQVMYIHDSLVRQR